MRVSVTTLGCKSNQYDSSALEDALRAARMEITDFPGPADGVVINTCTVTSRTDSQSRQLIRRARKLNPDAVVIVTGCYAQVSPDDVERIEGVDYVLGNPAKGSIVEYLRRGRNRSGPEIVVGDYRRGTPFSLRARSSSGRTRANLKIQEGCNRACSYCIIPKARGLSKSLSLEKVEREIDSLVEMGYREIVLTGIHLGAWGADLPGSPSLVDILKLVEKKAPPCRVRLSSIDPDEVTDELVDIMKTAQHVCNHLHLPLQSGDDAIIRKMNRSYTSRLFAKKINKVFREIKDLSVGVDVIVGFPGEGVEEFEATRKLLDDLPVSYMHIFPYSSRKGTPAAGFKGKVNPKVVKERCETLFELDRVKRGEFFQKLLGRILKVLVESSRDRKTGLLRGRTGNYVSVLIEDGQDGLCGKLIEVRLTGFDYTGMLGVVV